MRKKADRLFWASFMRPPLAFAMLALFLAGCSDADAEKLRRVGDKTFDRATALAQSTWEELSHTLLDRQPVAEDIVSRVKLRLQWDRDLAEIPITINLQGEAITLTGTVKSEAQKERAISLASQTLGVIKVQDELKLAETKGPVPPPAEGALPGRE